MLCRRICLRGGLRISDIVTSETAKKRNGWGINTPSDYSSPSSPKISILFLLKVSIDLLLDLLWLQIFREITVWFQ